MCITWSVFKVIDGANTIFLILKEKVSWTLQFKDGYMKEVQRSDE